jgi:hypothetical protein
MFAQLPPPYPVIRLAADQLGFHDLAAFKHSIPVQHSLGARPVFLRRKEREDGRAASGHPYIRANARCPKSPQPACDFPELGILLENDGLEIVRAERTRRHRAALTPKRAHEGLETINAT